MKFRVVEELNTPHGKFESDAVYDSSEYEIPDGRIEKWVNDEVIEVLANSASMESLQESVSDSDENDSGSTDELEQAIEDGVVEKNGAWYEHTETGEKAQGAEKAREKLL